MQNLIEIRTSTETGKKIEQVIIKLLERRQFLNNMGRTAEAEMIDTEIVKLQTELEYCKT